MNTTVTVFDLNQIIFHFMHSKTSFLGVLLPPVLYGEGTTHIHMYINISEPHLKKDKSRRECIMMCFSK